MAYIPPHKRHSNRDMAPSPVPESFTPASKRNLNVKSFESKFYIGGNIFYVDHFITRWYAAGLDDTNQFPCRLEPYFLNDKRSDADKPLALVIQNLPEGNIEVMENASRSPWVAIAEEVQKDLLSSFKTLRNEMENQSSQNLKPKLVARLGKIRFHWNHSWNLIDMSNNQVTESTLRQMQRSVDTNIPSACMEYIRDEVIQKVGLVFEQEKDMYHVKLSDINRPSLTVSCRCKVNEDKRLVLYKIELNQVRRMINDVICLNKNLDLRIMLCTRMVLTPLSDEEMSSIEDLIGSAVIDSNAKGRLRFPQGLTLPGNRYKITGASHVIHKTYQNPLLKLKVRDADRFYFEKESGEFTREVYLKLKGIVSELQQEPTADSCSVSNLLKENIQLIWENFLGCKDSSSNM